jgi:DNA-binding FrmR family transcriptional regulator
MECTECKNCIKTKHRTEQEKRDLISRLNKIEGQVKGVKKMIENDRYCDEILIQIAAIDKSMKSLGNVLLKSHLSTCVVNSIKEDNLEVIDQVMDLFRRLY